EPTDDAVSVGLGGFSARVANAGEGKRLYCLTKRKLTASFASPIQSTYRPDARSFTSMVQLSTLPEVDENVPLFITWPVRPNTRHGRSPPCRLRVAIRNASVTGFCQVNSSKAGCSSTPTLSELR